MVERRQRSTGEAFLGCSRYPVCRGTRSLGAQPPNTRPRAARRRVRLSDGSRYAKTGPEVVELLVARLIGRDLRPLEGCLVQLAAVLVFLLLFYWAFASGLVFALLKPLVDGFVHQLHFAPTPPPTLPAAS